MNKNSNKKRVQNLKGKMIEILIRDGKKNKEIARLCNISLRTVERYRKKIMGVPFVRFTRLGAILNTFDIIVHF